MDVRGGFTLLELGIVVVLIALIVSAVLTGRSMIENAEMRTIATERNLYTTALKEFIDKYQALPGDMNNAESYWYSDDSCPATPTNTVPKTPTCNGDGDGMIGDWINTGPENCKHAEWFRAWQQLANAGFIDGKYTGVRGPASDTDAVVGLNVPLSKTGRGGWMLLYMASDGSTDTDFYNSVMASHVLMYGGQTTGSFPDTAILLPAYVKALDSKVDDGMPFTGKLRVKKSTATTCTVSSATTSNYLMTGTTQTCQILFLMGM